MWIRNIFYYLILFSSFTAAYAAKNEDITHMPEYDAAGRVLTLNKMGWMHPTIDDITAKFIEFCSKHKGAKVFEIGAAYGYASKAALKQGAFVWINDLDERHLKIFKDNIKEKELSSKVVLVPGDFPDTIKLESDTFDAILAVRVLHFFEPPKLERAAEHIYKYLKKGGKAYIVATTPYIKNWAGYIPVYERKKASGDPYPGYFTNVGDYNKTSSKNLPNAMHFLDPEVLTKVFTKAGFKIEIATLLDRKDFPENMRLDGRESVGLIAVKE
jgi:SAM-dependent methyltransferase